MIKAAINSSPSNGSTPAIGNTPANGNTPAIGNTPSNGNTPSPASSDGRVWGYIRVSTREQNEARQVVALREFGVPEDCVFMDKLSGKDFNRPAYCQLLEQLCPGDVLVIKSIDRLGRNYNEILEQWRVITKERHAAIVVLDMPLLDTRSSRDLTGTLIADIVLQLLSYVAETERAFIRQRQAEGIAAAKARGVHFGRKPMERPAAFPTVYHLWETKRIGSMEAGRRLGVSHVTFLKWAREVATSKHPCGEDGDC